MFGLFSNSKQNEENIKKLTELGFTSEKSKEALKKFDNNVNLAANYLLLNGTNNV